ncbi:MAG: response regulator [Kastovskya adunca ATA6-11-RM4]|jgi:CheY-like chemotaxis protein|nr:response regulator [Kastovskya adunca ATA6-11-RM4]
MRDWKQQITILLAEESANDQHLVRQALQESSLPGEMRVVQNAEELLDYLYHRNQFSELANSPQPNLILLDLYLPNLECSQVLQQIKADPKLRRIPVVILTSSSADEDIRRSYELGASSYLTKPVTFESLVELMNTLREYWFEVVELPPANN